MSRRTCSFRKPNGKGCKATPMIDQEYCFWHSPEHREEAAEARRLGGFRRRREAAVIGAYDLEGLDSLTVLQRVLEIALLDTLGLDNSLNRCRTLEAAVQGQRVPSEPVFDVEQDTPELTDAGEETNE